MKPEKEYKASIPKVHTSYEKFKAIVGEKAKWEYMFKPPPLNEIEIISIFVIVFIIIPWDFARI